MSGDHTLAGTARAIAELGRAIDDHDESFVIVLSDANFDRYGTKLLTCPKRAKDRLRYHSFWLWGEFTQPDIHLF